MGVNPARARGSIRFSLGIYNTAEEVDYVLAQLPPMIARLRAISPLKPDRPDSPRHQAESSRTKHKPAVAKSEKDRGPLKV